MSEYQVRYVINEELTARLQKLSEEIINKVGAEHFHQMHNGFDQDRLLALLTQVMTKIGMWAKSEPDMDALRSCDLFVAFNMPDASKCS